MKIGELIVAVWCCVCSGEYLKQPEMWGQSGSRELIREGAPDEAVPR